MLEGVKTICGCVVTCRMRKVEADLQADLLDEQLFQARSQGHVALTGTCFAQVLTTCDLQEFAVVQCRDYIMIHI